MQTPQGNLLWDCITLLDDETIDQSQSAGRHPRHCHLPPPLLFVYGRVEPGLSSADLLARSRTSLGYAPRSGGSLLGRRQMQNASEGLTLIRCGGHFMGAQVLHWAAGVEGKGALLTGDIIQVVADCRWVSLYYRTPNLIPLSAAKVQHIVDACSTPTPLIASTAPGGIPLCRKAPRRP